MVTPEQIKSCLMRRDIIGMHAVGRALVHLYNRQTLDERDSSSTKHSNNRGFTMADAYVGSSMAQQYNRNKYLTPAQVRYWQAGPQRYSKPRITKYWAQLLDESKKKEMYNDRR